MQPVGGLRAPNSPVALVQDVAPVHAPEPVLLADSIENREDPSSQNPLVTLIGCIGSCLFITFVILVILPIFLVYKACQSTYEYLKDSLEELGRWLWPEETIPEEFHGDPVLSRNICPITYAPIRFPVYDRNSPAYIYEKSAILRWLKGDRRCPLTRADRTPDDYTPHAALQTEIEARLRELHQQQPGT